MSKVKIVIIISSILVVFALGWFAYTTFSKTLAVVNHPFDAIPDNNAFIIEFETGQKISTIIESDTGFITKLFGTTAKDSVFGSLFQIAKALNSKEDFSALWQNSKIYLSAHFMGLDRFDYLYTIYPAGNIGKDDWIMFLKKYGDARIVQFEGEDIVSFKINNQKINWYISINKGVVSIASNQILIQKVLFQLHDDNIISQNPSVARMIKMSGQGTNIHLYVNHDYFYRFLSQYASNYRQELKMFKAISDRSEFDVKIKNQLILLTGYSIFNDSIDSYTKIFATNKSVEVSQFSIIPSNTVFLYFQGAEDFKKYYSEVKKMKDTFKKSTKEDFERKYQFSIVNNILSWIKNEVSLCITSSGSGQSVNTYAVINSTDSKESVQQLQNIANRMDILNNQQPDTLVYRSYSIRKIDIPFFLSNIFGSAFNLISRTYFTNIGNQIIISDSKLALQQFIDSYLIGQNINSKSDFSSFNQYRSEKMNMYFYLDINAYNEYFHNYIDNNLDSLLSALNLKINGLGFVSVEISAEENGAFTSVILGSQNNITSDELMPVSWQEALDADIYGEPVMITNHSNNSREIVVFDVQNNLYRIDQEGKLQWKIPVLEKPMSTIEMVDFYKNGKYQYIFNTANYIYIIDLNGNRVENYPYKLPLSAIGSMSLMDYDNQLDYRVLIPLSDNKLHNFMLVQEPTPGWNEPDFSGAYLSPVRHYRLGTKDFLLLSDTTGNVVFANRRGEARIEAKLAFTNNYRTDFYKIGTGSQARLVTTDLLGRIIKIDNEGNVDKISLGDFSQNHLFLPVDFDLNGKSDYAFYDNNRLTIYNSDNNVIFDTLLASMYFDYIVPVSGVTTDSLKLVMHNSSDNSLVFVTSNGKIINKKEFYSTRNFIIEEATKNSLLRLITTNKRVVSNFLIK